MTALMSWQQMFQSGGHSESPGVLVKMTATCLFLEPLQTSLMSNLKLLILNIPRCATVQLFSTYGAVKLKVDVTN